MMPCHDSGWPSPKIRRGFEALSFEMFCSTSCSAALVRVQSDNSKDTPPGPFGYIGVAFTRREGIDVNVARARLDGILPKGRSAI